MKAGPKDPWAPSRAIPIARALVSMIVALSFLATLLTFAVASADEPGLMACCIGKPGHESGSCRTGLLESTEQPQLNSDISSSQELAPQENRSRNGADVKAEGGEHCRLHSQSTSDSAESPNETSEPEVSTLNETEQSVTTSPETTEFQSEPRSASNERTGLANIHALSSPCPIECGTCSVSNTRRPRPREQTIVSSTARLYWPLAIRFSRSDFSQSITLNENWSQLQPRAPPLVNS